MKLQSLLLSALFALPLLAQQQIKIVGAGQKDKDPINLSRLAASGPNAAIFKQVLQGDLDRSGYFYIDNNAQTTVSGQVGDSAGGVNASANVAWANKSFAWNNAAIAEARRAAHALADEIVLKIKGKRGIASTRILFVKRNGPDNSDLYVADADGANIQQLTFDNRAIVGPRWDNDGKHLFLTSYVSGHPVVYRMAAEPRAPKTVVARYNGLNASAAPSPDGKSVAIILSIFGSPDLFVLDRATGKYAQITKTPNASEASPTWSPDSKSICYVSDASGSPQLYIADVATKKSRRLTTTGSENVNPDWGINGRITYATKRGGAYQVAVLANINESDRNAVLLGPGESPSWAPNGRHIVCSRTDSPQSSSIWVLDTEGDKPVRLFSLAGKWAAPSWSFK